MRDLGGAIASLKEGEKVRNAVPSIISTWRFETWREKMLPKLSR